MTGSDTDANLSNAPLCKISKSWYKRSTDTELRILRDIHDRKAELDRLRRLTERAEQSLTCMKKDLFATRALRAPINCLSDDVLRLIFEAAAAPLSSFGPLEKPRDVPFQVLCSRVCTTWRRIALQDSTLWNQLDIEDCATLAFATSITDHRTNTSYLDVDVRLPEYQSMLSTLRAPLSSYLIAQAERLSNFRLEGSYAEITQLLTSMTGRFRNLTVFQVRWRTYGPQNEPSALTWITANMLRSISTLRRVRLTGCETLPLNTSVLESVFFLDLEELYANQHSLLSFLTSFPNLRHLCLRSLEYDDVSEGTLTQYRPSLHSLALLAIHQLPSDLFPALFLIDMPHLETVVMDTMTTWGNKTADTLEYEAPESDGEAEGEDEFIKLLSQHPNLSSLSLRMDADRTALVLDRLGLGLDAITSVLLPNLRFLRLVSPEWPSIHRRFRSVCARKTASRPAVPRKPPRPTIFEDSIREQLLDLIRDRNKAGYPLKQLRTSPCIRTSLAASLREVVNLDGDMSYLA